VVLLERDKVTSGTTWHAAGLMVTFGSLSETSTNMRKYSKRLYAELEKETGQSTGFMPVGFIELATNSDKLEEYRRIAAFNRTCGVDVHEISPSEVKSLFPLCRTDDVISGFYVKDDGRVNPAEVATSLAIGAKKLGVEIMEGVSVTGFTTSPCYSASAQGVPVVGGQKKVTGVKTSTGHVIEAEFVVNTAGMWARQIAALAGVSVPNQAAEHYYLVTDAIPEIDKSWPVVEDPECYTYIRPEGSGLLVGLFEPQGAAWNVEKIPSDFSFGEIPPNWDRMAPFLETAMSRVPITLETGAKLFFCGPESFTPDLSPAIGEAPELRNYFVAAGMNSIGILTGGGVGKLVANRLVTGHYDEDIRGMHVNRFQPYQANPEYRKDRVGEALGMVYKCHYPSIAMETCRHVKHSPFHDRLAQQGAYFREVSGWESPGWFAPSGVEPKITKMTWGKENWFPYWEKEHLACRNGVALFDMTLFSKFLVQGRDAGKLLNTLSTARVDRDNKVTYTQWLNSRGMVEGGDVTISKWEDDTYFVVATDTALRHTEAWLKNHITPDIFATVTDVSGAYATLTIQGPKSRDLLSRVTSVDVSNEGFPFGEQRLIDIGYAKLRCCRLTYVGELGYELFIPVEFAHHVYDRVVEAGKDVGLVHAGLKALNSLRIEKGYREFGHDIEVADSLAEVGLTFTCDFNKPTPFIGQEAVLAAKEQGPPKRRLVHMLVKDPKAMLFHGEVVHRNGVPVGDVTSGSYGHSLGGAVAIACVSDDQPITSQYISSADWQVDVAGRLYPVDISLHPLYDPKNLKIKM